MKIGGTSGGINQVMALRQEILQRSQALQEVRVGTEAKAQKPGDAGQVSGFADTLQNALQDVSAVQKRSSDMQAAYERGEVTDVAKVMLARQESGVAFEATLQVRNKLLSAYQDILRMGG
ncbi:flagellar hook-basal body complex protein FliE [Qipengyuania sp. S6317L1]|uniref:flagellar hook-basal body complex protein FliE n=1 Tax=Qipengyuania sp. S6317L1 TaxID=2926410 RepID=UPI001FF6A3E8|nr:flagellar hook-basal body complex protein FliE [Qipengyuania sp. S6317L1]MCK0097871.1 flagellar hook-basal body complex protein FliE [Qipengyuania sp. S6317L1]